MTDYVTWIRDLSSVTVSGDQVGKWRGWAGEASSLRLLDQLDQSKPGGARTIWLSLAC